MDKATIRKEIQALRALGAEMVKRTSRLEEGLALVEGRAPRKGRKMTQAEEAVARRNRFLDRKAAKH